MKGFERDNQWLSLCGLNCHLCPMFAGGHCGGCGNGNQSCGIARCSLEHGKVNYCYECTHYPCDRYERIDEFDSFITHLRQKVDLEKAKQIGIEQYNLEQQEKERILQFFLSGYNDGRKKSFFCLAVNLLELSELQSVIQKIENNKGLERCPQKEQTRYVVSLLQEIAEAGGLKLKLRKK